MSEATRDTAKWVGVCVAAVVALLGGGVTLGVAFERVNGAHDKISEVQKHTDAHEAKILTNTILTTRMSSELAGIRDSLADIKALIKAQ